MLSAPAAASAASTDQAVAYQLDAVHDGFQSGDPITAPLSEIWSVSFPGPLSYPLIVNGVVYVTAAVGTNYATSGYGTTLYAIDQATGATLWSRALGGTYWWSGLVYDNGRVFALNYNGMLTAFDATTGATDWAVSLPGQYAFSSAPTAFDGYVYTDGAGSGGTLYAVSEETGSVAWTAPVANGDDSSPAVSATSVYVTYTGPQDYAFNPLTGAPLWHYGSDIEGGGGSTPVLANGDIFSRDNGDNLILSGSTGAAIGSFNSAVAPAIGGGDAYILSGGSLTAVGQSGLGTNAWFSGDSQLDTAPLVVGDLVFEGSSSGNVYAVDTSTGTSVWSANAGSAVPAPNEDGNNPMLTGLGAGEGTLIVPAGSTLVAYAGANVGTGTPTSTSPPTVTGTPEVGMQIAADVGTWTALPTSYNYQWLRCDAGGSSCAAISGATADAYTPVAPDEGETLEVSITATNGTGTSSTVTSAPSDVVIGLPANVAPPTIAGNAVQGQSLNASPGAWTGGPTNYSYQWLRCTSGSCTPETGATSSTYVVARTDVGSEIAVEVTAVNALGSAAVISAPSAAIPVIGTTTTLATSENPAPTGAVVTLTATISPSVDGGTVSFSQAGTPIVGCTALPAAGGTGGVTCTGTFREGDEAIDAVYSGDSACGASSAGLTLVINPIATDPIATAAAPAPVAVTITGTPSTTSPGATITYAETGPVSSTTCTIDGQTTPCDDSQASLSGLDADQHTFVVAVTGPDSEASANVTWTITPVASSAAVLKAPADLRVHTTKHGAQLTWAPSPGASAYRLTVTTAKHTHVYMLPASRHSYLSTLPPHHRAVVRLRAVDTNGTAGPAATVTVR